MTQTLICPLMRISDWFCSSCFCFPLRRSVGFIPALFFLAVQPNTCICFHSHSRLSRCQCSLFILGVPSVLFSCSVFRLFSFHSRCSNCSLFILCVPSVLFSCSSLFIPALFFLQVFCFHSYSTSFFLGDQGDINSGLLRTQKLVAA